MYQTFAVYAGTFDPFTNGHLDIILKAAKLFDHITVLFANNESKKRKFDFEPMMHAVGNTLPIHGVYSDKVCIDYTDGFVADYCAKENSNFLIRGLRNNMDFMYEENIAKINLEINPKIETIYFRANNEVISSSMVKMLFDAGKDISPYVPVEVRMLMKLQNREG